ncbi:MAG: acyl-CoA carboxylase subunit beta [Acidimicrobiia bacterium]
MIFTATPIAGGLSDAVRAFIYELDRRRVVLVEIEGGAHHGAINSASGAVTERAARIAGELGLPLVIVVDSSGVDVTEGVSALHAWGMFARVLTGLSGVVPIIMGVTGACVSGPALLLGLADHVVMTSEAFAYVSAPDQVRAFTAESTDAMSLGGAAVHATTSGLATLVVEDDDLLQTLAALLEYLPDHHLDDPPLAPCPDPVDRSTSRAESIVPIEATRSYNVVDVIDDVVDADSFLELHPHHAPNLVVGYARLGGRPVGVVANQPRARAGTLDIAASCKGARFVQSCDAFNLPLVTFVDTPGYEPGRDLEWRGIIRYGAQLVHAYAAATVPRLGVVLRKAYGGAYIVMDSRGIGNDWCAAWPGAQIAVMGASGAVQILHGRELSLAEAGQASDANGRTGSAQRRQELESEYETAFLNPQVAESRGYVDEVIDPVDTRRLLAGALARFSTKRDHQSPRRHANPPL